MGSFALARMSLDQARPRLSAAQVLGPDQVPVRLTPPCLMRTTFANGTTVAGDWVVQPMTVVPEEITFNNCELALPAQNTMIYRTMKTNTLSRLTDTELIGEVKRLARCEREATVSLISHLAEFDSRRLYLGAGYPSLYNYCTEVLRLPEYGAYNRIEAARGPPVPADPRQARRRLP